MKLLIALLLLIPTLAHADIQLTAGECWQANNRWHIRLNAHIELANDPATALRSGITLPFRYQIALQTGEQEHRLTLTYNPLTHSYQLKHPDESSQNFPHLADALEQLGQLTLPLPAAPQRARLSIAADQLPFALRLSALFSPQWALDSHWWTCP